MQPSLTPSHNASAGVPGWSPAASGMTLLNTAYQWWTGTGPQPGAAADHDGPPAELSADMAALLDIQPDSDGGDFQAVKVKRDSSSAQDRKGSLDSQRTIVRHWLAQPSTVTRLADIGLQVKDVEAALQRNIASFESGQPARVRAGNYNGLVNYPQKPRPHDLFVYSVRDAMRGGALREFRNAALATTTPTVLPTAADAPPTVAPPPSAVSGVNLALREKAMAQIRYFRANIDRMLPFFGEPFPNGLFRLSEGRAELAELSWALDAVPCVTSLHPVRNGFGAVYPSPGDDSHRMHHVTIERRGEVFLSRTEDRHHVRYSLDRGRTWTDTAVYTDDVVEAEKTQLWASIIRANKEAKNRHIQASKWLPW